MEFYKNRTARISEIFYIKFAKTWYDINISSDISEINVFLLLSFCQKLSLFLYKSLFSTILFYICHYIHFSDIPFKYKIFYIKEKNLLLFFKRLCFYINLYNSIIFYNFILNRLKHTFHKYTYKNIKLLHFFFIFHLPLRRFVPVYKESC